MLDYGTWPLWVSDGGISDNVDPAELPISKDLCERIKQWTDWHYSTLDQNYPPDSDFRSPGKEKAFRSEGLQIWVELQKELIDYHVVYYDDERRTILTNIQEVVQPLREEAKRILAAVGG